MFALRTHDVCRFSAHPSDSAPLLSATIKPNKRRSASDHLEIFDLFNRMSRKPFVLAENKVALLLEPWVAESSSVQARS